MASHDRQYGSHATPLRRAHVFIGAWEDEEVGGELTAGAAQEELEVVAPAAGLAVDDEEMVLQHPDSLITIKNSSDNPSQNLYHIILDNL